MLVNLWMAVFISSAVCVWTSAAAGSEVRSVLRGADVVGMCSHSLALFRAGVIFTDV